MKSLAKKGAMLLIFSAFLASSAIAQGPGSRGNCQRPAWNQGDQKAPGIENILKDLTDDQKSALNDLRTTHLKEMKDFKNQMGEIRAKQRTIMSADPIDKKAAEKLIDQRTDLINKQMKAQLAHKAALKDILTEEQMLVLEQHQNHRQFAGRQGRNGGNGRNGNMPCANAKPMGPRGGMNR